MESVEEYQVAKAMLEWQIELGATEAICNAPLNRYDLPDKMVKPEVIEALPVNLGKQDDPVTIAQEAAKAVGTLEDLAQAMAAFELCELKKGARRMVFCDGVAGSKVMIIGEAPGRDEDREGRSFVGPSGQLLDRMLTAIGLSRETSVYLTNVVPWRPPQNRDPNPDEIAMMMPFLTRHVQLADPEIIVVMGNAACEALLGRRGISRMRGKWDKALGKSVLPMLHPAYLLRQTVAKREAWADILSLKAKLR